MLRQQQVLLFDIHRVWDPVTITRDDTCNGYPIYSKILVCPVCCHTWAKLTFLGDRYWSPSGIPCELHPEAWDQILRPVPGSILDSPWMPGIDLPLLRSLPHQLLLREFQLHLRSLEYASRYKSISDRPGQPPNRPFTVGWG